MTATTAAQGKLSHAIADRRVEKADRIVAVLTARFGDLSSKDVLDIGTGAGVIASRLSREARSLLSVDVVDERTVRGFDFCRIGSELLPCGGERFDAVVSNQVIEHVDDQLLHLEEIERVLRPGGVCYLAMPNRFALIEPHFKLPMLSWLPAPLRTPYVRAARRGDRYDVQPLTFLQLQELAAEAGLAIDDLSAAVAAEVIERRVGVGLRPLVTRLLRWFPAYVVLLSKAG